MIYGNVDSPNLCFTYFNFLGWGWGVGVGGQFKKPPCIIPFFADGFCKRLFCCCCCCCIAAPLSALTRPLISTASGALQIGAVRDPTIHCIYLYIQKHLGSQWHSVAFCGKVQQGIASKALNRYQKFNIIR